MEAHQLHRGRLIDHVHLVVRDLATSKRFYAAVLAALGRRIEGEGEHYFYSDELFVSTPDEHSGTPMRVHLAFQATGRPCSDSMLPALLPAARTTARPACASITLAITQPSSSIPTATTSRPCFTDRQSDRPSRLS